MTEYVTKFIESEKTPSKTTQYKITGVMMQYYKVCKREVWFIYYNAPFNDENKFIIRGNRVDKESYKRNKKQYDVNNTIVIDLLQNGKIIEVKPSSTLEKGARFQLKYYLWYLETICDIKYEGVLAHPKENKRENVSLLNKDKKEIRNAINEIYNILSSDSPPELQEKQYCDSCAYKDYCFA